MKKSEVCVSVLGSATECIFYSEPSQHLKGIVLVERALQFRTGSRMASSGFNISAPWWGVRSLPARCLQGCELFTDKDVVFITLEPSLLPEAHRGPFRYFLNDSFFLSWSQLRCTFLKHQRARTLQSTEHRP